MGKYNVAVRVDGSTSLGMGHVSTCLSLVRALKFYEDIAVYFVMRDFSESVVKVQKEGYEIELIEKNASESEMVESLLSILHRRKTDLLFTDLLEIWTDFSSDVKRQGVKLVSNDILGKCRLNSDIIVNRTIVKKRYKNYDFSGKTQYYLGPQYTILDGSFASASGLTRVIEETVKEVLIFFGGGDEFNLTARVAGILGGFNGVHVSLVLGSAYKGEKELMEKIFNCPGQFSVYRDVPHFSELLLKADLAICAGGLILEELAVTGTPAIIIPFNDHQFENAQAFAGEGTVVALPLDKEIDDSRINDEIRSVVDNFELRKTMSSVGKKLVDGKGADRVAKIVYDLLVSSSSYS